jgi:hypothetical protein
MGKSISKNPLATHPAGSPRVQNPHVVQPRDTIHDTDDPYLPSAALPDGTVCSSCGAVYEDRRWTLDERRRSLLVGAGTPHMVECPGCRRIAERNPQGIVTLHGDYWPNHREEILNAIRNEEARGVAVNPLERIMDIREEGDRLIIETTTEKLAQRIGRHIEKAHQGTIEYKWSDTNHLVRVEWERSLEGNGGNHRRR